MSHHSALPLVVRVVVVGGIVVSAGCGAAPVPSPFTPRAATTTGESDAWSPDAIERSEIVERAASDQDAMRLLRRLRPGWLRARGDNSFTDPSAKYPVVYIDEIRHGPLGTLYEIPVSQIARVEFFGTSDATTRWGTGHPAGVINVVTGRS